MNDRFQTICEGVLCELHNHREEIEKGTINWFSIKVMLKRDNLQATWISEENVQLKIASVTNGNGDYRPTIKLTNR